MAAWNQNIGKANIGGLTSNKGRNRIKLLAKGRTEEDITHATTRRAVHG